MHMHVTAAALAVLLASAPDEQTLRDRLSSQDGRTASLAGNELGAKGTEAIPTIVEELRSGRVGDGLRTAVRRLGAPAVAPLLAFLDEPCCRRNAMLLLTQVRGLYAGEFLDPGLQAQVRSALQERSEDLVPQLVSDLARDPFAASELGLLGRPAVTAVLVVARSRDVAASNAAFQALALMGDDAAEGIPSLVDLLESSRYGAARVLTAIGQPAVPALEAALERPQGRYYAALVLAALEAQPPDKLLPILADPPWAWAGEGSLSWATAAGELCWIGTPAYRFLLGRVADGDAAAARLLSVVITEGMQSYCWNDGLRRDRSRLILSKREFGSLATIAPPVLERAARVPATRAAALTALAALGKPSAVLEAAAAADVATRVDAAAAAAKLSSVGSDARFSVARLLLRDEEPGVRYRAALSAPTSGRNAAATFGLLVEALSRADDQTCGGMIQTVAEVATLQEGDARAQAASAIVPLLGRQQCELYATQYLRQLAPNSVPALVAELNVDDAVSWKALAILAELGTRAGSGAMALGEMLSSQDSVVRKKAAEALVAIGRGVQPAIPQLIRGLADVEIRWTCASALGALGPPAVEPLKAAMSDPARQLPAIVALGKIGPPASAALPALRGALRSADPDTHSALTAAIARIKPARPSP